VAVLRNGPKPGNPPHRTDGQITLRRTGHRMLRILSVKTECPPGNPADRAVRTEKEEKQKK
jgi:hypothetical protein